MDVITSSSSVIAHREIAPGAILLRGWLPLEEQGRVAERCLSLGTAEAGFYTPIVRGGYPMSVRMLCLGRHWNAKSYRYEQTRSDVDGLPVPPLPYEFAALAHRAAAEAGFDLAADLCIVNWYTARSRMGLHQDKDESRENIERGLPVVSVSIGDTARFLIGGLRRRDPVDAVSLESGDVLVFGGPSRLRYHGVKGIVAGTAPPSLGFAGRLNLTLRQF
jgi:DNA alkylation damage repair protein AlkB